MVQKQNNMTKKELKSMVAHAYDMKAKTIGTDVCFQIYANGHYILDTEEDNVIEVVETEEQAIEVCSSVSTTSITLTINYNKGNVITYKLMEDGQNLPIAYHVETLKEVIHALALCYQN